MSINETMTRFINTKRFYFIYPSVLITGLLLRWIVPESLYARLKETYWVSSNNIINKTFAHKGNDVFLILFMCLYLVKLYQREASKETLRSITTSYTGKLILKYIGLWSLFYIIDHIFMMTGGVCLVTPEFANVLGSRVDTFEDCFKVHGTWVRLNEGFCSLTPGQYAETVISAEFCYEVGEWIGGFDVSGHYCFLMTLSLILWNELRDQDDGFDLEAQQKVVSTWLEISLFNAWRWMTVIVLLIWINMLFVTAMFYHTLAEKVFGLAFGYVTPMVIYEVVLRFIS